MSVSLIVIKNKQAFDMSELVSSVKWSGKRGSAARTLEATLIDRPDGSRSGINPARGDQCIFRYDGAELFRGMFMKAQQDSKKGTMTATAYDNAVYLANNKDTFVYSNITAGNVFLDVCTRFGIKYGGIADTLHVIPELTKPRTTGWDVIQEALQETFKANGLRFYVLSEFGELKLFERRRVVRPWALEPGVNMQDWNRSVSTEKVRTRIKMYSRENAVVAEARDEAMEELIGIFQDVESEKSDMNEAQLQEIVDTSLAEKVQPTRTLSINALGQADVYAGVGVYVIIGELRMSSVYYVESDTHTFEGGVHTMSVKLTEAQDFE